MQLALLDALELITVAAKIIIYNRSKIEIVFFRPPTLNALTMDQNQSVVTHLKDIIHTCLESEVYGHNMTFKVM